MEKIEEELGELPALEYLNLRSNKIPDMENLLKLFAFTTIKKLNVINCPVELGFSSMNIFLAEVLIKYPTIANFCKIEVNDTHKLEAVFLAKHKWIKSEEERKKLEEEERLKAEAEEGEGWN